MSKFVVVRIPVDGPSQGSVVAQELEMLLAQNSFLAGLKGTVAYVDEPAATATHPFKLYGYNGVSSKLVKCAEEQVFVVKEEFADLQALSKRAQQYIDDPDSGVSAVVGFTSTGDIAFTLDAPEGGFGLRFLSESGVTVNIKSWFATEREAHTAALLSAINSQGETSWSKIGVYDFRCSKSSPELLVEVSRN